jgi:hypothetical protein
VSRWSLGIRVRRRSRSWNAWPGPAGPALIWPRACAYWERRVSVGHGPTGGVRRSARLAGRRLRCRLARSCRRRRVPSSRLGAGTWCIMCLHVGLSVAVGAARQEQLQAQVADRGEQAVQDCLVDDRPGDGGPGAVVAGDLKAVEPGRPTVIQDARDSGLVVPRWLRHASPWVATTSTPAVGIPLATRYDCAWTGASLEGGTTGGIFPLRPALQWAVSRTAGRWTGRSVRGADG